MMEKQLTYLIVPDVHGRDFWVTPVEEVLSSTDGHIVFLGDYHDPYPGDFDDDVDYETLSLEMFKQILDIKKKYPERVTLLIGNHDCGYAITDSICSCRMDRRHRRELTGLFRDNRELFQIAEECTLGDRHIIFSHAGILKGWADRVWGEEETGQPGFSVVDHLNNAWFTGHYGITLALGVYDNYRGWGGSDYGSPVWSDIRSWARVTPEETFGFNIAGHTQCDEPVVLDQIMDLDCRRCFYLDDQGQVHDWDTGDILVKTRVEE